MKKMRWFQLAFLLTPAILAVVSAYFHSLLLLAIGAALILLVIWRIPGLSIHANIWAFLMLIPIAAVLNFQIDESLLLLFFLRPCSHRILRFFRLAVIHMILLPVEQLTFGFLVRLVYPRQYTLRAKE